MTETRNDATDIAWLRNLAEEGTRGPFRGGSILMAAGLIYGLAAVGHWAVVSGTIAADPWALAWVWLGATALFVPLSLILEGRLKRSGGVRTAADRAAGAAWSAVGFGIFAMIASIGVVIARIGDEGAFWLLPSVIMVFYGLGWGVSAAMTRSRALGGLAAASFLAAPLLAGFSGQDAQYLAYAAALFALMALPGFLLMRAARR